MIAEIMAVVLIIMFWWARWAHKTLEEHERCIEELKRAVGERWRSNG